MLAIRRADARDAVLVCGLLRELGEAQGIAERVTVTPRALTDLLFPPHSPFTCEIVEVDGKPAGFMVWQTFASTMRGKAGLYLEDLYVMPAHRGQGLGRKLMAHLARTCVMQGLYAMQWSVHADNHRAWLFYERLGAEPDTEWRMLALDGAALARLATEAP
jgi:diamine N-acetyltransferase